MIVPVRHVANYSKLTKKEHSEIIRLTNISLKALDTVYAPHGFNIGLNIGSAAGAGIPDHLHFHVVPRWENDANFMTSVAQSRVIPDSLDGMYGDLKKHFHRKKV